MQSGIATVPTLLIFSLPVGVDILVVVLVYDYTVHHPFPPNCDPKQSRQVPFFISATFDDEACPAMSPSGVC